MVVLPKAVTIFVLLTLASLAQAAPQRLRSALDDSQITVLRGNIPHMAQARFDRGPVNPAMRIQGASLVFNRSAAQQADADNLLKQLQDPDSPNYHKWLTPLQYADRFGMSPQDIEKVAAWLRSHGLQVDRVANGRDQIFFSGTAAQVQSALHTQLHQFATDNQVHFANATEPALPTALASSVLAVRNLNDFRPQPRKINARKVSATEPRFSSGGGDHFISPDDLATIYNIQPLYDIGVTGESAVAVVGQTEVKQTDVAAFRTASGLPANPFQAVLVPSSGASTVVDDDVLEADLDVEWSGAVARTSPIFYVYTGNSPNFNVIDALQYAVDQNLAPVISVSYGLCESSAQASGRSFFQTLAQKAIAQGQTISAATGDNGAADCEDAKALTATKGLAVDLPSAVPEVTGVGGSEFSGDVSNGSTFWSSVNNSHNASALTYIPETSWNDTTQTVASGDGFSSGGGGHSSFFVKPSFQSAISIGSDTAHRYVPDIALNASAHHDGYLVCSAGSCVNGFLAANNTILLVGGTSVGAPVFAGFLGLVNQATQSSGQGPANPTLYQLAAAHPNAFHDITTGDNKVPCTAGKPDCTTGNTTIGYSAAAGYDMATGLGSLNMFNLASVWPGYSAAADYTLTSDSPDISITSAGASGSSKVTVASTTGFTGTLGLECAATPELKITCAISPASVNLSPSASSVDATLTVTTVAAQAQSTNSAASLRTRGWMGAASMTLAGVFALAFPIRRRRSIGIFGMVLFAFLLAGTGCGGGSSTPATPSTPVVPGTAAGGYTVVVKATSGSVTHTTNVHVTVP